MDIFFQDPTEVPLPPQEVRIRKLLVEPWPDGKRVRVYLELTPFQKQPNGEISIMNNDGEEVATVSFIETINPTMQFTLHLRNSETAGNYSVSAMVFYSKLTDSIAMLKENQDQESLSLQDEIMVVDQRISEFIIPTPS
jgi:hypothetical protein